MDLIRIRYIFLLSLDCAMFLWRVQVVELFLVKKNGIILCDRLRKESLACWAIMLEAICDPDLTNQSGLGNLQYIVAASVSYKWINRAI